MIQEIKYNGFTANPSDYESADGELATAIGLVPEDGALKPVLPPKKVLYLDENEKVKFVHKVSAFTHYIIYNSSNGAIKSLDKDTNVSSSIGTLSNVSHFNAVGNTLLAFSNDGINYFLWKNGAYTLLGNHIPDIEISFGLVGHPRLFSLSDESKSTFTITFNGIGKDDLFNEFSEDNKTKITEQVMAKVNKFIAQETTNKGRFCFPFFVRYALRLYDGSLVYHSAPVLMNPTTINSPVVFWKRAYGEGSYQNAELDIMLVSSTLDYRLIHNSDYYNIEDWTDIVKGIDVFISKPIYTFDQEGKCESFNDTDNYDTKFIGRLYSENRPHTDSTSGGKFDVIDIPEEDKLLGEFTSSDFLDEYMEWKYSNIYAMYFSVDRTYPNTTLHLPEFSEGKRVESIENVSTFYKLCSLEIEEATADSNRKDIVIDDDYLQSLVTREVMTDDYLSHDYLYADYSFAYNSRLNLAGIKRKPFCGFLAQSMLAYVTCCTFDWKLEDNNVLTITPSTLAFDSWEIGVLIKENGEDYQVRSSTTYYDNCNIGLFLSEKMYDDPENPDPEHTHLVPKSWATYFFYPNINAYKMLIYNYSSVCYVLDLKPHDFLNGAYARLDYELIREKNFTSLPYAPGTNVLIDVPNKIYTSEVNNPFYFPVLGINTIGTGTILGICSAAKALSQGQFGQFPLYAFSTDGVWALEVSDTGTYSAKQPITRDVCINPDSITQIDSAVLFATDRGIMLISGSEAVCLSDSINSRDLFAISDLPKADKLVSLFNERAGEDEQITLENSSLLPFRDFLTDCKMIYDYTNQRIIVYNPSVSYAYVYSLKSKLWGMIHSNIADNVNSYPDALAMLNDNALANFSLSEVSGITALVVTRPFKLGYPDVLKTIDTVIQRGYFQAGHVAQILYGSRDLFNWHIVWSSTYKYLRGFRGSPYKYFRLALICQLDKAECIDGCTVQFTPRLTNKPR